MSNYLNKLSNQMRANIDTITSDIVDTSITYNGVTSSICPTKKRIKCSYKIKIEFHNKLSDMHDNASLDSQNEYFTLEPLRIQQFKIEQNFIDSYLNHYELNATLTVPQFLLLYNNHKNLLCNIYIYQTSAESSVVTGIDEPGDPVVEIKNAFCIFKSRQDVFKEVPQKALINDTDTPKPANSSIGFIDNVLFQIMPQEDYNFRLAKIGFILHNSTVGDAIRFLAKGISIKNDQSTTYVDSIMLIPPDNAKKYENLIIPPLLSIPDALQFLQEHYGVYHKGLNFYYQFGALYVYPKYTTASSMPNITQPNKNNTYTISKFSTVSGSAISDELSSEGMCHIYAIGKHSWLGLEYYHAYEGTSIHLITNTGSQFVNLADLGADNVALGYATQHSDRVVDKWSTVLTSPDMACQRNGVWDVFIDKQLNTSLLTPTKENNTVGVNNTLSNFSYMYDRSNEFNIKSDLYSYRRVVGSAGWLNAIPFTFKPGFQIHYHYDSDDKTARNYTSDEGDSLVYTVKSGIINNVTYTFGVARRDANNLTYGCAADFSLSLEV